MNIVTPTKETPSAEELMQIQAEQVGQLYRNAPLGMAATVINAAVLSYVQWHLVPQTATLIWLFCLFILTFLRSVHIYLYHKRTIRPDQTGRWRTWFVAGMALSGIIWGSAGIFLFPLSSTAHQALLLFVLGGMVAGAAGTYSIIMASFLAYSVPALAPLIVRLFSMGDEVHVAMGGMTLLFGVLLYGTAQRVHLAAVSSLKLRFENNNLISYLASAKERAEKLNEDLMSEIVERKRAQEDLQKHRHHLEEVVAERTAEWSSANVQLRKEIAARKEAEETLRRSEEYSRSLIENALDLITVLDSRGTILFESPSIEKLLGYQSDELIGIDVFTLVYSEDLPSARHVFTRLVQAPGTGDSIEIRIRHKNGSWRLLEAIGKSIGDVSGSVRIIINSRDITERKKLEEDLLRSQKLESLGILAGGIAHDFNNMLTGITANIELAKMYATRDDELYLILKKAELASARAKDLTQQLLTFSLGGEPVKKPILIGDMIREAAAFSLAGSRAKCVFSIPDDLWPIEADEAQMRQVIHNIMVNADQAMPQGGVITIACENVVIGSQEAKILPPGEYVKVSIADLGVGISREHLSKIFDPYFTTKQKGSGLGLAATYSIIKRHGGDIAAESIIGAGTTFVLHLPASRDEVKVSGRGQIGLVRGTGRVLIMDDEEIVRDAAKRILQTAGYEAEVATDGREAIDLFRKAHEAGKPFSAVIMDLTVPGGIGGKEAIKRLLEIDPTVRAIVSSGYSHDPIMANYRDYGFKGVIAKPYKILEMSEIVQKVIADNISKGKIS
jgi:two-component system cell cycle sensor histidine kinase/response regulator CckA